MSAYTTKKTHTEAPHEDTKKALRTGILKAKPRKDRGRSSVTTLISTPPVDYGNDYDKCGGVGQAGPDIGS